MSESRSLKIILSEANKKEAEYDWLRAVEFHAKLLDHNLKQKDYCRAGNIQERIGYCFYKSAMQADNQEEFGERMRLAMAAYDKAHMLYGELGDEQKARMTRCRSIEKYLNYWTASEAGIKKGYLNECWRLAKEALETFKENGDNIEFCATYTVLSKIPYYIFALEWSFQDRRKAINDAIVIGEQAISLLSEVKESTLNLLVKSYVKLAVYLNFFIYDFVPEMEEKEKYVLKAYHYWEKARKLSEETALLEALDIPNWLFGSDLMLVYFKEALEKAKNLKDRYLIGNALDMMAYASFWEGLRTEDPDKRLESVQRALEYAEDAKQQFDSISFISSRGGVLWTGEPLSEYYWDLARTETDLEKKKVFLQKAVINGTNGIETATNSGYPSIIVYAHHVLSKALGSLAQIQPISEKRQLLEKGLEHREATIKITEQLNQCDYFDRGSMWNYSADLKAELSSIEKDNDKKRILEDAISDKKRALQLCDKDVLYSWKIGIKDHSAAYFRYQYSYGELLNRLYKLTGDTAHQKKAIKALEETVATLQRLEMPSRIAECYWKAGLWCDEIFEYTKAAEFFTLASNNYKEVTKKIPQLKDFYQDHSTYMSAWAEIEKAKQLHAEKKYGEAKIHYEDAASLHKSTERWRYLSPRYQALARVEEAEDLSRKERTNEAGDLFKEAAELFQKASESVESKKERTDIPDEKEMTTDLIKALGVSREYCLGRIDLEEAKILDRNGDHARSSNKYGSAAKRFQDAFDASELESDRQELKPIIDLSKAWEIMTLAEAEATPKLYIEASQLFDKAKEHSLNQETKMLALGHSSFSKALEAGAKFEATRDMVDYKTAKSHMEAAENCYLKAGFKDVSEYAKATYTLFDAYMYTHKAETETDPTRKAQNYQIAEKLLEVSVNSYLKAQHPEKSEEVERLLLSIKEKRQLAISLTEVLHAPAIIPTTTSFTTPTPIHEKALGLERFEHATIEASLKVPNEIMVDEDTEIRLDMVNVAKEASLIIRIDEIIPPSFHLTTSPTQYSIEKGSIDMKGKRLDSLKVETIKLNVRATEPAVIELNPQIVYVDELGKFKKSNPDRVTVTVYPKLAFEFKTEAAGKIFSFLVESFVSDYMRRKISQESSGWRTLMNIVKKAKVPKSSVYGRTGEKGKAIAEIERRGLVETRVFPGERGRGGKIIKMRIPYEKEIIKRHIDQQIMKNKEK